MPMLFERLIAGDIPANTVHHAEDQRSALRGIRPPGPRLVQ